MKKVLAVVALAMIIIGGLTVLMVTLVPILGQETIVVGFMIPVGRATLGVIMGVIGTALYRFAEKGIFDGWKLKIMVDGKEVIGEYQKIHPNDAESMLIEYDWPLWMVLFGFGGSPHLKGRIGTEKALRLYCHSLGEVNGNINEYAIIDIKSKTLTIQIPEKMLILRKNLANH